MCLCSALGLHSETRRFWQTGVVVVAENNARQNMHDEQRSGARLEHTQAIPRGDDVSFLS